MGVHSIFSLEVLVHVSDVVFRYADSGIEKKTGVDIWLLQTEVCGWRPDPGGTSGDE